MRRRHLTLVTLLLLAAMTAAPACAEPPAARALLLAQIAQGYTSAHTVSLPKAIKLAVAAHRAVRKSRPTTEVPSVGLPWFVADARTTTPAATLPRREAASDTHAFLSRSSRANAPPARA